MAYWTRDPAAKFRFTILLTLGLVCAGRGRAQAPALPPGVRLEPARATEKLNSEYDAQVLSIDWTHPLLRATLESGLRPGEEAPLSWAAATRQGPEDLRIQLIEPSESGGRTWSLALPAALTPAANDPAGRERTRQAATALAQRPSIVNNGLCPWLPAGPPVAARPELETSLGRMGQRVGVRWLGQARDLDRLTSTVFPARCLLSWVSPETGQGRFALVAQRGGRQGAFKDILPWLKTATRPGEWVALHSTGPFALAGAGAWRLTEAGNPRRAERLGITLRLAAVKPGEPVDWARLPGCKAEASSNEPDYAAPRVIGGRLWPSPFNPPAWVSRPGGAPDQAAAAWVELKFDKPRPVDRVFLAWADAGGWSADFRPRHAALKAMGSDQPDWQPLAEFARPATMISSWSGAETILVRRLRLEFPEPGPFPNASRARLCAMQAWGPWDGTTGQAEAE